MMDKFGIKQFFNNMGVASAIMAGFAFTAIIELRDWAPVNKIPMYYETMYAFLVLSFLLFVMPLLLNSYFVNIPINSEARAKVLRGAQLIYTILMGGGVGCLLGAFCLFVIGHFKSYLFGYLIVGVVIVALIIASSIMRYFKMKLKNIPE